MNHNLHYMFQLQIKEEYHKPVTPKCRAPIRNIEKFNNNKEKHLKQTIPKCRPPIRNIKNSNKDNNNISKDLNSFIYKQNNNMVYSKVVKDTHDDSNHENSNNDSLSDESSEINQSTKCNFLLGKSHNDSPQVVESVSSSKQKEDNRGDGKSNNNNESMQISYKQEKIQEFRKSISDVRLKFTSQKSNVWNAFSSQVEEVINESTKVSIIILLGNETNTIKCLAYLFGDISGKALGSDNYLIFNTKNIKNDHGEIINGLRAEISSKKAVIIEDLLNIGSEAVKVLHNLCDKENPLIPKTMYIITIISNNYEGLHKDKFVEDSITAKFSKFIDLDILNPLITRIMDGPIISISPESNMKGKKNIGECLLL
ncbi:GATA zinc finger domain-containing protein 4-like isoform X3 [Vespula maculifrons]|uniref:GATA zinc finger domain-containing protein 4-like isoform X3 n=1 Tax=Vespula maculifrons TaxID=7453 RepID=A0ABD2CE44_VESMC